MRRCCNTCSICGKNRFSHTNMEANYCKSKMKRGLFRPRNNFSKTTILATAARQKGKCARCDEYSFNMHYHHKHGRVDNNPESCEGLCSDCHKLEHSGCIIGYIWA